jgi:putative MATE family efflux protein
MLLQMTSAGAMGGGVSSAIARALGSGNLPTARRLVVHALVIAALMGAAFSVLILALGPAIYALLGGKDATLANATRYSTVVFAGAITVWMANTLSSVLRGTGNMLVPAVTLIAAAVVQVPLSGFLVSRIGIAGAGFAYIASFGLAAAAMAVVVFRRSSALRPSRGDLRLDRRLFREILRVGGISVLSSFQTVLTAVILTGYVGRYGPGALAGYGVGLRLELLQIPLVFAVGQAMVVLVGVNIGAKHPGRAKRIAWIGTAFAASISLAIGLVASLAPLAWVGLFSSDPGVLESGSLYLRTVAPFYPMLAANIALYFASQGAGKVLWPVLAGTARLVIVIAGGAAAAALGGIFIAIAAAMAVSGVLTIWFVARTSWS